MKRVKVAAGKFVTISPDLAEKATLISAGSLSSTQARGFKALEPRLAEGLRRSDFLVVRA